jgi:predicted dehydrogenase
MDYLRPPKAPTHGDDRVRVAGSDGVIEARGGEVLLIDGQGERQLPAHCDRKVFKDFVEQVEGKGKSLITAEETIELTRVCLLALESADTGRPVNLGGGLRDD